ncbi:aminopeptidase N [Demequina sp. TTPB684]|uniref:aminopeptidase N n=1 Tax=unclassified Demequina TaxID=2620311 RepID=UPI001CF287C0|nr:MULTISPECIES: aminopeptidase N [unclassified Demequina]MCB2412795.1 aminopeptidase N [Demequina sp. TTPB684]UPU87142.1 aminopeptidase N [Demequina sp. TMPB413]
MPGTNLTRAEAEARAAIVSTETYAIELDLTTSEETFRSTSTVTFAATAGASTFIDLIAPTVHSITLNGKQLDPAAHFEDSRISLPDLAEHNTLTVVADGAYMNTGEGLHRFIDPEDGEVYLYSQFEVADTRRVYAVFEQPDLKAEFTFSVTAPDHWHVLSNSPSTKTAVGGTITIGGTERGVARWDFSPTTRIPCYVTAIVAGPYHEVEGSVVSRKGTLSANVYCRKALAPYLDADVILDDTQKGFTFYEEKFGMDYPFEKYDQIFVPEFNAGAMENAGCVTFLEDYVFRSKPAQARVERRTVTVLHELAHMWFGDLVTMKWWNDLWLNESFAEFTSTLATVKTTKWVNNWVTFNSLEKSWAYRQDQLPSTHPIMAEIRDLEDVEVNFDGITYAKGASVLKQLVYWVGEDEFFAGVAEYMRKHHHANATLNDLLVELEKASGRDLAAWSDVWLQKAGVTTLRPIIETAEDGVITRFAVAQEAPDEWPTLRPHRLVIGCYDEVNALLARTEAIELDIDGAVTEVPALVGKKLPALILVNDDDLAYAKVRLDPHSLATAVDRLSELDALPRSMVLSAAWDMTRDAEMPARQFIDLVLNNLGAETESTTVLVLLRQLASALSLFTTPSSADTAQENAADALWHLALEAEPGSDNQLQLVRAFASLAVTDPQLDNVQALVDDKLHFDGLTVDADLAWDLLISLVAGNRAGEVAIELQLTKDATASGARRAAHARAALPGAEFKRAAWDALINAPAGKDLPNAIQSETTAGFNHVHDVSILEPYVDEYFAMLRRIYKEKTNEMAANLIEGLYPVQQAGRVPDLQDKADAWLADNADAHDALKRLVIEGRDSVRRALEAQAADAGAAWEDVVE